MANPNNDEATVLRSPIYASIRLDSQHLLNHQGNGHQESNAHHWSAGITTTGIAAANARIDARITAIATEAEVALIRLCAEAFLIRLHMHGPVM